MKRLKAGPEIKMPDLGNLRVPAFLEDLYYDLKDRRLLPLVALAIVAIVAVPFLLSGGSDEPEPSAAAKGGGGASASSSGAKASLTVVRATPGLRDYRKRLRGRTATDPFKQRFTAPDLSGSKLGSPGDNGFEAPSPTSTSTSTSTTIESTATSETKTTTHNDNGVVTTETETNGSPNSDNGSGNTETTTGSGEPDLTFYSFAIDVRVKTAITAADGSVEAGEPVTASKLLSPAPIPTEKTPVVVYIGVSGKTGNPVMLVSEEVSSIFGEAKCVVGSQRCQLLELEVGMPATFVYGPAGERYKITVVKVERIHTDLPERLEHTDVSGSPSP
jgi:hypothetical protein